MARRRLSLTDAARADLTGIRRWLRQPGAGPRAHRRLLSVERAVADLRLHPCRHPPGECAGTREMVAVGHRIVYRVAPDTADSATAGDVVVLRVFGPGQDRGRP